MSRLFAGVVWRGVALRPQTTVALQRRLVLARKLVILALQLSKITVRFIFALGSDFVFIFCLIAFEKALILLYVDQKQKKKDRDRVSRIVFLPSILLQFCFEPALISSLYTFNFFQLSSVSSVDEIKFKTIIPASSLVVRDHCWLNDAGKSSIFFSSNILLKEPTRLD